MFSIQYIIIPAFQYLENQWSWFDGRYFSFRLHIRFRHCKQCTRKSLPRGAPTIIAGIKFSKHREEFAVIITLGKYTTSPSMLQVIINGYLPNTRRITSE